ncbi:MAG: hypothetical protein OEV07_16010, partial [Gammaproteobacteria bacterium]|nr:hypothetical protein [Gammaproteobacteria bacterium]
GLAMLYPEDNEAKENNGTNEDQQLLLDGTANLDYADDDPVPRVKGLIELINQYFRNKPGQSL